MTTAEKPRIVACTKVLDRLCNLDVTVSLLALGSNWMDWSHAWGGEMHLKRALEKLNLEYPHDSDD
jgi:hypothetical protein